MTHLHGVVTSVSCMGASDGNIRSPKGRTPCKVEKVKTTHERQKMSKREAITTFGGYDKRMNGNCIGWRSMQFKKSHNKELIWSSAWSRSGRHEGVDSSHYIDQAPRPGLPGLEGFLTSAWEARWIKRWVCSAKKLTLGQKHKRHKR
jgi:hypothetical protein